jgi:hypothetical protein
MGSWNLVEKKAKSSLATFLRDQGFASLAAVCKERKLGPEAGAELSALCKALQPVSGVASDGQHGSSRQPPPPQPWSARRRRRGGVRDRSESYPWRNEEKGPGAEGSSRTCYVCGNPGHFARDCRSRQSRTLEQYVAPVLYALQNKAKGPSKASPPVAWTCTGCGFEH